MTTTLTRPNTQPVRSAELLLAHAHLRLGSLALARTELETLAGMGKLDSLGLVDLAEVRWRTGDLAGAGEAAAVALRGDEEHAVALLIAAEAAASLGRPSESRRLAARAMACATGSIDAIFAGMPRSAAWPPDADEPPPTAPTLFDRASDTPDRTEISEAPAGRAAAVQTAPTAELALAPGPMTLGLWADDPPEEPGARDLPEPALELEAGRTALVAGKFNEAVLHFGLALRLAPALAPAVLEATAGARAPNLLMVRGDAYRLAGHEDEAKEAYLAAARGGLPERRRRSRTRPATTETGTTEWTDGTDGTDATSRAEASAHDVEEGVMTTFDGAGSDGEADVHDASAETEGDAPG
jgi:tetratricopeptide (TPR) repeat protein